MAILGKHKKTKKSISKDEKPVTRRKVNAEREEINTFFRKLKFKKQFFGVDEQDVWKKFTKLNTLYEGELRAERIRYDALLSEYRMQAERTIQKYFDKLNAVRQTGNVSSPQEESHEG